MTPSNPIILLLFILTLTLSNPLTQSHEQGNIKVEISNKGLEFLKDLLIKEAESSLVPLKLPKIERSVKIPFVGTVQMGVSNTTIQSIHVTSSTVKAGDNGFVIDVSGATANLSMNWKYEYSTWLLPIAVSDKGSATIQVEGLEIGLTLSLKTLNGSLTLSVLECGCYVNGIFIKLDGGASWLYQGLIDAFEDRISAAVEDAVSKKLKEAVPKLDSLLQSLPKQVPVTDIAQLNVTIVDDPKLNESSLDLEINGLFCAKDEISLSRHHDRSLQASDSCNDDDKMVKFSLHEDVLKSASSVYFEAGKMHWMVDKVPDQSILNTAWWRFMIPHLYKTYPNRDMNLNLSISSTPIIEVEEQYIKAIIPLDVVLDVLDGDEVVPVACISVVISSSVSAEISKNVVSGSLKLNDFTMSLKWSKIGDFHMRLIQTVMSTMLKTVALPYVNLKLGKGLELPVYHGYELQDAQFLCSEYWIVMVQFHQKSTLTATPQCHPHFLPILGSSKGSLSKIVLQFVLCFLILCSTLLVVYLVNMH